MWFMNWANICTCPKFPADRATVRKPGVLGSVVLNAVLVNSTIPLASSFSVIMISAMAEFASTLTFVAV